MNPHPTIYVALLHDGMHDKQGKIVTTSLTLIDIHDMARSSRTFGVTSFFVVHPSPALRKLARTVKLHWEEGFGAAYNPKRKEAVAGVDLAVDLDEVLLRITDIEGKPPIIIGTSAQDTGSSIPFSELRNRMNSATADSYLLLFGTGWGMSAPLLERCEFMLEPIRSPLPYNHLSVRAACAIALDRLLGIH